MMIHMYLYCTRSTWWWWYTCTCIVPDLHDDDDTHVLCVPPSCRSGTIQVHVYHHHVDLVQYRYMWINIIMLIWYKWWWYTCTCIVPDLHDGGTHVPVLYQTYIMMIHMYLYCTISTWWWYACTCIAPDLHVYIWKNTGTCVPSSSCRSGTIKCMCIIIIM
jgi:hypothetical protein